MKLEKGMYVRTEYGIAKYLGKASYEGITGKIEETDIDEFDNLNIELWSGDVPNWVFECDTEDIVLKASHDIIDLIEVGDYVNGYKVLGTNLNLKWWDDELGEQDEDEGIELESYGYIYPNSNYHFELKSIVTKEQFEAMQYKIK